VVASARRARHMFSLSSQTFSPLGLSDIVCAVRLAHLAHTTSKIDGRLRLFDKDCIRMQNLHSNALKERLDFIRQ